MAGKKKGNGKGRRPRNNLKLDNPERAARQEPASTVAQSTAGHNAKVRKDLIRKAREKIRALNEKADPLREQVKNVNKQIGDVYRDLKTDLGMKRKDAEFAFRLLDLEEEDDRDATLDTIREIFESAGEGESVDWIKASEKADAKAAEIKKMTPEQAKEAGVAAGKAGKDRLKSNPHEKNSPNWIAHDEGWCFGQAEIGKTLDATRGAGASAQAAVAGTA